MGVESESDSCLYIRGEKRENEARGTQIEPNRGEISWHVPRNIKIEKETLGDASCT